MSGTESYFPLPEYPLLSICIPTYNRAKYLTNLLKNLTHSFSIKIQNVETIIADNASTDETLAICELYRKHLPIKIISRSETIVGAKNYIDLINNGSNGKYCLIMGDDDMLVKGGLEYLLSELNKYAEAHFFINNFGNAPHNEIIKAVDNYGSEFLGDFHPLGLVDSSEVQKFYSFHDSIASGKYDFARYLSFLSLIFRRDTCLIEASQLSKYLSTAELSQYEPEYWFTHYVLWLRSLKNREGYFLPKTVIIQGVGTQIGSWANDNNIIGIYTNVYPLLFEEFVKCECNKDQLKTFRREIVIHYWSGVFLSLKKRIWPFNKMKGWLYHSFLNFPILAKHPKLFLHFLVEICSGWVRRYIKHPCTQQK